MKTSKRCISHNVDFYHAYYKMQRYLEETGQWKDTCFDHQGIIVVADSIISAKIKVNECLKRVESNGVRAVLNSKIVKCIGIAGKHGFDWSFEVKPIMKG